MSPPRRRRALDRHDLEALLAHLERSRPASTARSRTSDRQADEAELTRLRRLVADAIADELGDEEDDDAGEDWEHDDLWRQEGSPWGAEDGDDTDDVVDTWGGWTGRGRWQRSVPEKPIAVEGGLTTRSRRGAIGETWWSKRFLAAVEAGTVGGRSDRGRSYARRGQVIDLTVQPGLIEARVQGTRRTPYRVRLAMTAIDDAGWYRLVDALASQAGYAARLLAGELPHEAEDVFVAEGFSLFPSPTARLSTECTCPDWANPCKHIAAVCYLVAEAFDRDPFAVLAWRGRDREALLGALRERRTGEEVAAPAAVATPAAAAPPLSDCLLGFWKAGPELAAVRVRPEAAELPGAVLRHLAPGLLEVRGRDVSELLDPAYVTLATAAARRALGGDGSGGSGER